MKPTVIEKDWKKEFDENFGTGIDMSGCVIGGYGDGAPLDYDDIKQFIFNLLEEQISKAREEVIEEVEKERNGLEKQMKKYKDDYAQGYMSALIDMWHILDELKSSTKK